MGKIIILDENTANKIAAGEVIERPASVIKELVENSIDAGADKISVEIRNGGISFIRVIDNGTGIDEDDTEIAFERHATSKIRRADDLSSITSMGFRGEALASIAAVSDVQLLTRVKSKVQGVAINVKGGCILEVKPAGCPTGTSVTVRELFFNTPARYKFLKKDSTEAGYAADTISRIALGHPDISFKLVNNGATALQTPGNSDLKSTVFSVYGAETAKHLLKVDYSGEHASVTGFVGKAEIARSNRNHQSVYINGRYIRSKTINSAIDLAYSTFLMKNKHPFILLNIALNPASVDVNVHPSKMDVKFSNEQDIFRAVYNAIQNALLSQSDVRTLPGGNKYGDSYHYSDSKKDAFYLNKDLAGKPVFKQQDFELIRKELDNKREDAVNSVKRGETAKTGGISGDRDIIGVGTDSDRDIIGVGTDSDRALYGIGTGNGGISSGSILCGDTSTERPDMAGVRSDMYESGDNADRMSARIAESDVSSAHALFQGARIIGQAFSTYILLEGEDELYLLDQHAAHERIRYEKLKKAYASSESLSQMLMASVHVELTAAEYQFALNETEYFNKLGFSYEAFGTNSVLLRSVPYIDGDQDFIGLFLEILDFVMSGSGQKDVIADEALFRIACKSAIKANKRLDEKEIAALLDKLAGLDNPYTCPHGRPSIMKLRRYELEKLFKRIV